MEKKKILLFLALCLNLGHCYPQFNIPNLNKVSPEDINSLEIIDVAETRSIPNSNSNKNKVSIEDTIKEVEDMIKNNPHLPRLTRGEILDLIENITQEELKNKNRGGKNLMVVMPYTPQEDGKNMEDLFTKPPVTQIIGNENNPVQNEVNNNKRRRPQVKFTQKVRSTTSTTPIPSTTVVTTSTVTTEKPLRNRRRRPTTLTTVKVTTTSSPIISTTHNRQRPLRRRTTTSTTTYSPTETSKYPNHRYSGEEWAETDYNSNDGFKIIEPPKLHLPQNSQISNLAHEESPVPQSSVLVENIEIPQRFKNVIKDMNLESALKAPVDHTTEKEPEVQTASPEDKLRLKELLDSLGVLEDSTTARPRTTSRTTTKLPDVANVAESLSPEMRQLLVSFGLLPDTNKSPRNEESLKDIDQYYPEKPDVSPGSYVGFKPLPSDAPNRDDMNALLANYGLGRDGRNKKSLKNTNKDNEEYNLDMIPPHLKGVLSDLGLSPNKNTNSRQEKKIETKPKKNNFEEDQKSYVFNPDEQYASKDDLEKLDKLLSMIKELEKLNGTATDADLKKFDLETLKDLVGSLNQGETLEGQESGPDPNYEIEDVLSKNEVKRQTSTTAASASTTSTTATTTVASTTTTAAAATTEIISEEKKGPSLSDLEDSFGGQTSTTTAAPTTSSRPNGLYYLLDWNSFLDIDDQNGRRVNLRFQPKVGNPKNFLSVKVP